MKITEQQFFDYIFCPAKFEMKYARNIDIQDPISLPKLLNKVSKYFYINLLNGKICTMAELKSKWDSICKANPNLVDAKKNLAGISLIYNLTNWAARERISILDVDTRYSVVVDDVEIEGCMEPILATVKKTELLITSFSDKIPDQTEVDMKLKYTLDCLAFKSMCNKDLDGVKVHVVNKDIDILTRRNDLDYRRLNTTIKSVGKAIQNEIFYPRENVLCTTCTAKEYCRYWYK